MGIVKWAKFGEINAVAFLGKEVIAIASGIHVIFINLNTKEEKVEKFDNCERGDGASCLSGHPVVPMFAIAERCLNPKISIFTYPEINRVSSCIYKKSRRLYGFISSTFAGTEYFITLTSLPDFQLIVWLWKTGENLKVIDTEIMDNSQQITCSPSSPFLLTQMGQNTGQLIIYEMTVCSKIISLNAASSFISTDHISSTSWTYDGNLLLCDDLGNVSLFYTDGKRRHVVINSNIHEAPSWRPLVVDFRGGAAIVNTESKILFYRKSTMERVKSASPWKLIWQIETSSYATLVVRHPQRDSLLIFTIHGEILEVSMGDDDVPRMQMVCHQGSGYLFLLPINPDERRIGVIDIFNRLIILETLTGHLLSITPLNDYGKVLQAAAHKSLPLIVTSTGTGKCNIISAVDVTKAVTIRSMYLIKKPLDKLKFSLAGNILGVSNNTDGQLFIINGFINMNIQVLTVLNIPVQIIDFLIWENGCASTIILVLVKTHSTICIGKNVIVYSLNTFTTAAEMIAHIELTDTLKFLHYGETQYDIIGSPYLTKQLHLIKTQIDYETAVLTDAVSLPHQLRDININSESRLILTFGYDGILISRSKANINTTINVFTTHHRRECGIEFAIVCLHHDITLCLGGNRNLIAIKLSLSTPSSEVIDKGDEYKDAYKVLDSLTQTELNEEMTWIELKHAQQLEEERAAMAEKRAAILLKFSNLKERLREMLDANEKESEDVKLSVATFDLDDKTRNDKIKLNTSRKEALMEELKKQILGNEKLTVYLREIYWESMHVPPCTLISFDGKICVKNYVIPVDDSEEERIRQEWMNIPDDISKQIISIEQTLPSSTASTDECPKPRDIKTFKLNEDDVAERLAMCGTTTHRWIPEDQMEIYDQINKDGNNCGNVLINIRTERRKKKLKEYFNKLFINMRAKKEEAIKLANEQMARISHCVAELKEMFGVEIHITYDNLNFDWHDSEKPKRIVTVDDSEIHKLMNTPMALSHTNSVDEPTVDDEKKLLGNHFCDQALEKMMDGVLEMRWEDEIKRDIAKPDCLAKNIEDRTEEELEMIRQYKISVENLRIERLKYRSILEEEIKEVQDALKRNVGDFDSQLKMFFLERMKIESAIQQEDLMSSRALQQHQFYQQSMDEVLQIENKELNPAVIELKKLIEELSLLETAVNETRSRYENLLKREKTLEGKFRDEFPDLKQPMVEHLLRHYKKRPRIGQLICTSITYLMEMSKCIVNGETSEILPRECIDFLKGMQSIDVMPSNLPSQIDTNHWFILCRIRRAKVEIETRLKSCAVELAEAEQTFLSHQKTIQNSQSHVQQLHETIENIKRRTWERLQNVEIQLVLKMGQIEVELCGHPSEFDNAMLVPFDVIFRVNDAIIKAGRNKVAAMYKTMEFQQTIEWHEWHHRCLRLTLEDMREDLKDLQGVKVTKEIQKYLMRHFHAIGPSKDDETWERSIESTKKRYIKLLENEEKKLIEITKAIDDWQQKNDKLDNSIKKLQLNNSKLLLLVNDEVREKHKNFSEQRIIAIMKCNRLVTKVQTNYEKLLSLRNHLESLRLKTYPTLRLNHLMRDRKTIDQ